MSWFDDDDRLEADKTATAVLQVLALGLGAVVVGASLAVALFVAGYEWLTRRLS